MNDEVAIAIIVLLGSNAATAVISSYLNRRKTEAGIRKDNAEADATELETRQAEVKYYRDLVESNIEQMTALGERMKAVQEKIDGVRSEYERRIGELHGKLSDMARDLKRANTNLDIANETIRELRQEVSAGNIIITELRGEISQLLVEQAEQKGGS